MNLGLLPLMLAASLTGVVAAAEGTHRPAHEAARVPVIVELFTSEGCSSCPPADDVLARLGATQPVRGVDVLALGEHVDYWNHLGWTDPFSSAAFTTRQSDYARVFGNRSVYTPQMVVNGRAEFVGSDWNRALASIAEAGRAPEANVAITRTPAESNSREVGLAIHVAHAGAGARGEPIDVTLAITESGLESEVTRGENAGRRLRVGNVVRQLEVLPSSVAPDGRSIHATAHFQLESGWNRARLSAVAFAQERASRRILGSAQIPLE